MGNQIQNRAPEESDPPNMVYYRHVYGDYAPPLHPIPVHTFPPAFARPIPLPPNVRFGSPGVAQGGYFGASSSAASSSRGMVFVGPPNSRRTNGLQADHDEELARALQMEEMESDFQNMSVQEPYGGGFIAVPLTTVQHVDQDVVDVDGMSYEQLQSLGERSGSVSRGLSENQLSLVPTHKYKPPKKKGKSTSTNENTECPICQMDYKKGESLAILPCTHQYHERCIKKWLRSNKTCCLCKKEAIP